MQQRWERHAGPDTLQMAVKGIYEIKCCFHRKRCGDTTTEKKTVYYNLHILVIRYRVREKLPLSNTVLYFFLKQSIQFSFKLKNTISNVEEEEKASSTSFRFFVFLWPVIFSLLWFKIKLCQQIIMVPIGYIFPY